MTEPKFEHKPLPGHFDLNPPSEEELVRSMFEDGFSTGNSIQNSVSFNPMPEVPRDAHALLKMVNAATERLTGVDPAMWDGRPMWKRSPETLWAQRGAPVFESIFVPRGMALLVDNFGAIHRVINLLNYQNEMDASSLCIGEMR